MLKIISLFFSTASAKVLAIPLTQDGDVIAAFKSMEEYRYSLYGALALFVIREIYSFIKDKASNTGTKLESMEHRLIRLETILNERLPNKK